MTPKNVARLKPMTSVRRLSRTRVVMICMPLIMMKAAVNSMAAAITGFGSNVMIPSRRGSSAPIASMAASANAMVRLATPVAATSPAFAFERVRP